MAELYTREADRKRLSLESMHKLADEYLHPHPAMRRGARGATLKDK